MRAGITACMRVIACMYVRMYACNSVPLRIYMYVEYEYDTASMVWPFSPLSNGHIFMSYTVFNLSLFHAASQQWQPLSWGGLGFAITSGPPTAAVIVGSLSKLLAIASHIISTSLSKMGLTLTSFLALASKNGIPSSSPSRTPLSCITTRSCSKSHLLPTKATWALSHE